MLASSYQKIFFEIAKIQHELIDLGISEYKADKIFRPLRRLLACITADEAGKTAEIPNGVSAWHPADL